MEGNSRALLKKYCLESSVLGLKYFYLYPDRVSRCYWTLTMVFCVGVACLLSVLLYWRFSEMPTWITIENHFEPDEDISYPAITLCSPNQMTISAVSNLKKNIVNGNLSSDFIKAIRQFVSIDVSLHKLDLRPFEQLQNVIEQNRFTVLNVLSMLPQRCEDFLKRCIFQQKLYPCEDLFDSILTPNGMCCVFNSIYHFKGTERNERKMNFVEYKLLGIGRMNGLSVLMDYNPQDAMDNTLINAGATNVLISDWREFPAQEESILVRPGIEAFHMISFIASYCSEDVEVLPVSSRNCYFADEHPLRYFKEYRTTDCDLSCFINEVEQRCLCTPHFVPSVSPYRACNFTTILCIKKVIFKMSQLYESGKCNCLRNCESRRYYSELAIGNLEGMEYMVPNPFSDFIINKSTSLMYFYFPTFRYMKQKQDMVMSPINLVSYFGGLFGLCLGGSFISLLEMWFYIYIAIKNKLRGYLTRRSQKRVDVPEMTVTIT